MVSTSKRPKLYISGPMTGMPDHNYPAFHAAAENLRSLGYQVVNPAENFDGRQDLDYGTYIRKDISQVVECDGVYLLQGWEHSRGALLELHLALTLGLLVFADVYDPPVSAQEAGATPGSIGMHLGELITRRYTKED